MTNLNNWADSWETYEDVAVEEKTTEEVRTETRRIPADNMGHLEDSIEKLNRRAKRLNLEPLRMEVVGHETEEVVKEVGGLEITYTKHFDLVEIVGESPVLPGWELVSKLTPAEGEVDLNMVHNVPGKECPVRFRESSMGRCDHCRSFRHRKDTFVVHNTDTDEYKVVGRNCIGDFLGHASPESLLSGAEFLMDADTLISGACEDGWGLGRGEDYHDLELFVAMTVIFIRRFGWVPRSKAVDFGATADQVWMFLQPPLTGQDARKKKRFAERHNLSVTDEDRELARKAIDWIHEEVDPRSGIANDYLYNLRLACGVNSVNSKRSGLVASLVPAYNRHVEKLVELELRKKAAAEKVYLGEIKKRYIFPEVTVKMTRSFETFYGVTTLVIFETPAGNDLKWFASGDRDEEYPVGEKLTIVGTVKDHDEYKGVKQTVLNRVTDKMPKSKPPVIEEPNAKTDEGEAS